MIGNGLAYASVAVRDVNGVAEILQRDFQLSPTMCAIGSTGRRAPVFPVGKTAIALFELGDEFVGGAGRTGVHHLAVSVDGVVSAGAEAAEAGMPVLSSNLEWGLGGTQRLLLDPKSTAGVITYLSEPLSLPTSVTDVVERIDHLGVASSDNNLALEVFGRKMGWAVESTQVDSDVATVVETFTSEKYGVIYRTRPPQLIGGVRVAFITIGDCELEFLQNLDADVDVAVQRGRAGSTSQDQGVITRFIESRGPGLHHLALKVSDINGLLANLEAAGHNMIDTSSRGGSRRAQIGFIHPASLGGLLVHLVQREEV